ncbi:hypothetical protein M408DRAFT_331780 [Serendipita vermifera MAFF 305830]|uniref:Calcineurin-like phosphoesterase domain-containing protein n=1 Tax=Serendipita vermifera MAFF 305830 TaxID=933852 RepID=A0A0C3AIB8_SERVB|nr:hypothetical protein M408DRAFT_331780 [Serendipita vermifera MAFF 305830]
MTTRPRSSSIPSLADAQYALHTARKQPARRIAAYTILAAFLGVFLILGFGSGNTKDWEGLEVIRGFPKFDRIEGDGIHTLTESDLKAGGKKRFIIVGDIHGMHGSFKKMMSSISYTPSKDHLIHVGDLLAKGPSSPAVLQQLSSANVTGVRGNHDQKVIEWAAWIEWVVSHHGGRAWLKDMESKSEEDLEEMKKKHGKKWKIPDGWKFGGEHYWLARNLKSGEERYLSSLPLVLHLPDYHIFLVHAGILPLNPTIPLSSKHQPLSHVPGSLRAPHKKGRKADSARFRRAAIDSEDNDEEAEKNKHHPRKPSTEKELRTLQERMVLQTIPQNTIPFNLLNMRSLERNSPVRTKKGRPWSEVWNSVIDRCKGFPEDAVQVALTGEGLPDKDANGEKREKTWWETLVSSPGEIIDWDPEGDSAEHGWSRIPHKLPCHPSTVIYGHAAGRGLDVKDWSIGLDSGCVYGRRMTAMVLSENEEDLGVEGLGVEDGDDDEGVEVQVKKVKIGDGKLVGRLVSVKCPDVGA